MEQTRTETYNLQGLTLENVWQDLVIGKISEEKAKEDLSYIKETYGFAYTEYRVILITTTIQIQVVNSTYSQKAS